jgi:hypothetical protein
MAEDKKGFILYADLIASFEYLSNEQRGEVIWWVLQYVNDKHPEPLEGSLMAVIATIRAQLKRDLEKYEKKTGKNSESGRIGNLKRWQKDLYGKFINKEITLEEAEVIANDRKVSLPDKTVSPPIAKIAVTDTVTDNGTDTVTEIKEVDSTHPSEAHAPFKALNFLTDLGVEKQVASDFLKNRKTKRLANTKTAFDNIHREMEKSGLPINDVLKVCVNNGWGSFKNSWDWKKTTEGQNPNGPKYNSPVI